MVIGPNPCGEGDLIRDGSQVVISGDCIVSSDSAVLALRQEGISAIWGQLTITGDSIVAVNLPDLKSVQALYVTSTTTSVQQLRFDGLQRVEGVLDVSLVGAGGVSLPVVGAIDGDVRFTADSAIEMLALPMLERAPGFSLSGAAGLRGLALPQLIELDGGGLHLESNSDLTSVGLPSLARVNGDVVVSNNEVLPECAMMEMLTGVDVGGAVVISGNRSDCTCEGDEPLCR